MNYIKNNPAIIAGDIGGTKTNIGIFIRGKLRPRLQIFETYSSREWNNFEEIIIEFLSKYPVTVASGSFGIAGPVVNGICEATNLPWKVSEANLRKIFKWKKVKLINDLTATALAIPILKSGEYYSLNRFRIKKEQNLALIAPGTGLGEALLLYQNGKYIPFPSEGGHADFAPTNKRDLELWRFLNKRYGHVSVERAVSGPGLINIYEWLKSTGRYRDSAKFEQLSKGADTAAAITKGAIENNDPLCKETLNIFINLFGAETGNLALKGMTTGGVYLGGGIPPKILDLLRDGIFLKAFYKKGRFSDNLRKIPVRIILNDKAALLGAAYHASENND